MKKKARLANQAFSILVALSLILNTIYVPIIAYAQEGAEEGQTEESVSPEPEQESVEEAVDEEEPVVEETEEEPAAEETEEETEEATAPEETVSPEEETIVTDEEAVTEEEPTDETIDETSQEEEIVPDQETIETEEQESGGGSSSPQEQEDQESDEETNTEENEVIEVPEIKEIAEGIEEVVADVVESLNWVQNEDGSYTISELVIGKTYKAPQNPDVRLVFHTLPEEGGTLTITEITLTPEQMEETGALSETAYDITSDMEDGTFSFDLTLPLPDEIQSAEIEVKSAETVDELENAETENKEQEKVDNTITIKELDHFTVYVLTTPNPDVGVADILINEIVVNPGGGSEWVELYNNSGSTVDLTDWTINDATHSTTLSGDIDPGEIRAFDNASAWINNTPPESIFLKDDSDTEIDRIDIDTTSVAGVEIDHYPIAHESVGRTHEGGDDWFVFAKSTKGEPNVFTVCFPGCDFTTIGDAIDRAGDGDTIIVYDDTYEEQLIINESLTIIAPDGATILTPESLSLTPVDGSSQTYQSTVFIDNDSDEIEVWFEGFTIDADEFSPTKRYSGILVENANATIKDNDINNILVNGKETFGILVYGNEVLIEGNTIPTFARGGIGIYSGTATARDNVVTGPGPDEDVTWAPNGIQFGYGASGLIEGNDVSGCGWPGEDWAGTAVMVVDTSDVIVRENNIFNNEIGLGVIDFPGELYGSFWDGVVSNIEVTDNDFSDNSYALDIENDVDDVDVTGNSFVDSEFNAIYVGSYSAYGYTGDKPRNININYNSISGNTIGIEAEDEMNEVNGEYNWWGAVSGPSGVGSGSGDAVSENVAYCPYLTTDDLEDLSYGGECLSQITGRTFLDIADNGLRLIADGDHPDGRMDGFTVRLYDDEWDLLDEQTTNTTGEIGQFKFTNLLDDENQYYVCGVDRDGYLHSPATLGQDVVKPNGSTAYPAYAYAEIVDNDSGEEDESSVCWDITLDDKDGGYLNVGYVIEPDTTPPTAPVITAPIDEETFGSTPILNEWTASTDDSGIDHYQIEYVYDDGHTFSGAPYREVPGTQTWRNHTPNSSEQGGVTIRVRAYDPFGNVSAWSNSVHYYYDFEAPDAPTIIAPTEEQFFTSKPILNDWTDVADESGIDYYEIEYKRDNDGGLVYRTTSVSERNHTPNDANQTGFTIRVRAVDNAGLIGPWSETVHYYYDATPPAVPTGLQIEQGGDVLGCGVYTDERLITINWDDNTEPDFDHYVYQNLTATYTRDDLTDSEFTGNIKDQDGEYGYRVKAVDTAGNESAWTTYCGITLDREDPEAPTLTSPEDGFRTQGVFFSQTWDAVPGAVSYEYMSCNDDPGDDGVAACSSPKYTNTYTGTTKNVGAGQPNSHFWWRVRAKDAADNWSLWSESRELIIDNDKPETEWTGEIPEYIGESKPTLYGTSTDVYDSGIALVEYQIRDSEDDVVLIEGNEWNPATPIDGDFDNELSEDFSVTPPDELPDGEYTFYARATDGAGNVESTAIVTIIVDTTPPTVTLLGDTPQDVNQGDDYEDPGVETEDYEGCAVTIEVTGISSTDTPGVYEVVYTVTDCAGNTTTATRTVNVNAVSGGGGGFIGGGSSGGGSGPSLLDLIFGTTSGEASETGGETTEETGGTGTTGGGTGEELIAGSDTEQGTGEGDGTNLDETDNSQFAAAVGATGFQIDGWTWFWIIIALIVIALVIYFLYYRKKDKKDGGIDDMNTGGPNTPQM